MYVVRLITIRAIAKNSCLASAFSVNGAIFLAFLGHLSGTHMYSAFVAGALFTGVNHPLSFLVLLLLVYIVQRSLCDGKYNLHKSMFNWVTGGWSVCRFKIRGIINLAFGLGPQPQY